jgi:hypothetical protein
MYCILASIIVVLHVMIIEHSFFGICSSYTSLSSLCSWRWALRLYLLLGGIWSLSGDQESSSSLSSSSMSSLVQTPSFLPSSSTSSQDKETTCEFKPPCFRLFWLKMGSVRLFYTQGVSYQQWPFVLSNIAAFPKLKLYGQSIYHIIEWGKIWLLPELDVEVLH